MQFNFGCFILNLFVQCDLELGSKEDEIMTAQKTSGLARKGLNMPYFQPAKDFFKTSAEFCNSRLLDVGDTLFTPGFSFALGPSLCGDFVVESPLDALEIPGRGKAAFVDMETSGFLRACHGLLDEDAVHVVRAVSDKSELKSLLKDLVRGFV